jgi:hypothetical protein
MRMTLHRRRRRQYPPLPASRPGLSIPDPLKLTISGQPFLMESGPNNDFLIFCSPENLTRLCFADLLCMDGTFDACPALYSQLFTIHAFDDDKLVPLVYCLMAQKNMASYNTIFAVLKQKAINAGQQLNPSTILSDFESGLIPSVAASFPTARHRGCHFHFCQAIYRKVQALGLTGAYDTQPDVRLQIRQLMALAFLPVAVVRITFNTLETQANPILQPVFQYFRQQWLTNVKPVMWNTHNEDIRTNNDCEGWHVRFNNAVRRHHPNVWQFLGCLRDEQASVELLDQQIAAGHVARRHNKKYAIVQRRLQRLQRRYTSGVLSATDYITGVSHNLHERH